MIHKLRYSVKTIPNISLKNVLLLQTRTEGFPRRTNYRECSQGLPPTWQQLVRSLRYWVKTIPNISLKNVLLLQTRTEGFPRRTNYRECSQGLPPTWQQLVRGSGVRS